MRHGAARERSPRHRANAAATGAKEKPPGGGDSKASGQLEPDGQPALRRRIAQLGGGIREEFLLCVLDHTTIAFLAAELFDILHGHGFAFQQEGLSDGSAHNEHLHFKAIKAVAVERMSYTLRMCI